MNRIKKSWLYREGRYIWRSFAVYKKPGSYLWHRYLVGPHIRHVSRKLDRPVETEDYSLHILCSHKDLTMLLWSLASWYHVLPQGKGGQVYIHEDGSFTLRDRHNIKDLFPSAQIVEASNADSKVEQWLSSFPTTLKFRLHKGIPLMRKLIDPYFTGEALYKVIVDSDILWFEDPKELFNCIVGKKTCAALSNLPMKGAVAEKLSEDERMLNSGVVGYSKELFALDKVENLLNLLGSNFFGHHVEQAAYAYALSNLQFLPFERYSLKHFGGQVMRHYTGPVREKFWIEGIEQIKSKIL